MSVSPEDRAETQVYQLDSATSGDNWTRQTPAFARTLLEAPHCRAERMLDELSDLADLAINTFRQLLSDERAPASVRLKAAMEIAKQTLRWESRHDPSGLKNQYREPNPAISLKTNLRRSWLPRVYGPAKKQPSTSGSLGTIKAPSFNPNYAIRCCRFPRFKL